MKRILMLLLAAFFVTPLALAEEAFFAEESFEALNFAGEETFFEENAFFAEDGFFGDVNEEPTLPEEVVEEAETEDRSLLLLATDPEYNYPYPAPENYKIYGYYLGNEQKLKPGEVKLTWEQKDASTGKFVKKLAKGWKWVIYRTETQNGVWLQVGTSTKPTITLKNQPTGYHMYIVRPEYKKGNYEEYGEHTGTGKSENSFFNATGAYIQASNLWKTIETLNAETHLYSGSEYVSFEFTTLDRAADLNAYGTELRFIFRLYGSKGSKKELIAPTSLSYPPSSYVHRETHRGNGLVFTHQGSISIASALASGMTKFELQITPVVWNYNEYKIVETGKTKKASFTVTPQKDRWKTMAPAILRVERDYSGVRITWRHGPWPSSSEAPDYYEVYDGKRLISTVYCGNYTIDTYDAYIMLNAPGKHKLTVCACSWDKKVRGKASSAYILNIPKSEQEAPILHYATVTKGTGYTDSIAVAWSNPNPLLTDFEVIIIPGELSAVYNYDYWPETEYEGIYGSAHYSAWSTASTYIKMEVQNGTEFSSSRKNYLVCVLGYTPDYTQKFISDPIFLRYNSSSGYYESEKVTLKR